MKETNKIQSTILVFVQQKQCYLKQVIKKNKVTSLYLYFSEDIFFYLGHPVVIIVIKYL